MRPTARIRRIGPRLLGATAGAAALFLAAAGPAAAVPGALVRTDNGPNPQVELHSYCAAPGQTGHLADGTTVYCSPISGGDTFAWSYYSEPLPMDPNTINYNCDSASCTYPDGSQVPEEQRCGMQCGEPPTPGNVQNHLNNSRR
ncbi:hypothetical protein [Nocardia sp. NPDC051750]|jgi:hypothetical protein|uniref:hypothetical protein n=1 Tax=Nocardia sp. NPDC051750 TaxID=3364325 RepID=UPI0037B6A919